jgi:glycosyltransferase involved in cell wall biosynthesis
VHLGGCGCGESALRVALDSRPVADLGGIGRYSRCLLKALRDTAAASDEVLDTNRPSTVVRSKGADVFHSPWIDGAMLHSPCPMVVTIHDVAALKRRSEHLRSSLRGRLRPLAVQRAMNVIVPSKTVAEDAVTHLRLDREKITVIAEAADASMYRRDAARIASVRERFALPERYLVWVGDLQHPDPGTRIAKLVAAERELPLVLVGPASRWAHELPDVTLTGQVDDEQLAAIYSGAHALIIPSKGAGFGQVAVEALACGTPVVASEGPALREALGDRAHFVAEEDMRALVETAQRSSRPAPAPPPWSWEDAARETWNVYARAVSAARGPRSRPRTMHQHRAGGLEAR